MRARFALIRFAGRIVATAVALLVLSLVVVQYARIANADVTLTRDLSSTQDDIAALRARRSRQLRDVRRLESPEGAIPEIHDRLRLVGPRETIIFVSPGPSPAP